MLHGKKKTLLKTKVIKKNLNPVWHKEIIKIICPPSIITIQIKDQNFFSESKSLGEIILDLSSLFDEGRTLHSDSWIPIGLGGTGELHIKAQYFPETIEVSLFQIFSTEQ